ncbi:MAG: leucine-rich repeat domain-containing protein [Bacteroidales bacterium]|nr:leucine-rich repeat domain-containing protein [Bacteroidales bacterium]
MKKILPFLIVWVLGVPMAHAFSFSAQAPSGQTLYFTVTDGSSVKVVAPATTSWNGYTAPTGVLTIPATVVNEGNSYSVTAVDRMAFQYCYGLTGVVIPGSVVSIGQRAFAEDTLLASVTLQEGVQRIDMMAFISCTRLDTIELPSTLTRIAVSAFENTAYYNNSENWNEDKVLTLGQWVLKVGNLAEGTVQIEEGLVGLANNALLYCRYVDKVLLPVTMRIIGDGAFKECYALDTLQLLCEEPPSLSDDSFDGVEPLPVLVVPCSTATAYGAAQYWNAFSIVEVPCPVAIGEVESAEPLSVAVSAGGIVVRGADGMTLTVSDMLGRTVHHVAHAGAEQFLPLPAAGVYVLRSGSEAIKISYSK